MLKARGLSVMIRTLSVTRQSNEVCLQTDAIAVAPSTTLQAQRSFQRSVVYCTCHVRRCHSEFRSKLFGIRQANVYCLIHSFCYQSWLWSRVHTAERSPACCFVSLYNSPATFLLRASLSGAHDSGFQAHSVEPSALTSGNMFVAMAIVSFTVTSLTPMRTCRCVTSSGAAKAG